MKTNRIKYAVIILIIIPLALVLWDAYGRFFSHQQKKYAKTGGFKNRPMDYKQIEAEEYLAIWEQWNKMQEDPVVNITGEWLVTGGPGDEPTKLIIQQKANKVIGTFLMGEYVFPLEGKVSGNKFVAISILGGAPLKFAVSIKGDKMEGMAIDIRPDGFTRGAIWVAQKVK